jgi:hypothetical protein
MKRLATLAFCAVGLASAADLTEVHNVYLLKMSKGFDQYLANRLTGGNVFQVVTDPKLADTIITEQIGESFEAKLDELFPPPEAEKPAKPEKKEKTDDAGDTGDASLLTDTVNKLSNPASSFSRGKGMVFLVDAKSKQVVWSAYGLPKDFTSKELDRTANDIVSRLKRDLKVK